MTVPIIQIGNSRGIRIPQAVLKQCNATDKFELHVEGNSITLIPIRSRAYDLTFQEIESMDDSEIITMLETLDAFTIAVSLIGADQKISDRIYNNLSKRAFEMISQEVERLSLLDAKQMLIEMHRAKINSILKEIETT